MILSPNSGVEEIPYYKKRMLITTTTKVRVEPYLD
jgi:hypothetical protein